MEKSIPKIKFTIFLGVVGSLLFCYVQFPSFQQELHALLLFFKPTSSGFDFVGLRDYLAQFGLGKAALISALLMIMQGVIAPLPALVITIANGLLFGSFWGGVLSLFSAVLAAQLCYEIAHFFGRPFVVALVGEKILKKTDQFMVSHGTSAILISRLIPVIPFDPISYGAGLTRLPRKNFLRGNLLGQIPATFIYSTFGAMLLNPRGKLLVFVPLMSLAIISICIAVGSAQKNKHTLTSKTKKILWIIGGSTFLLGGIGTAYLMKDALRLQWSSWVWANKAGAPTIKAKHLKEMLEKNPSEVILLDARAPEEYAVSRLKNAYRFTVEEWKKKGWPSSLPKDKPIVVYCTIGYRSGLLTNELCKEGFLAKNLYGGILNWASAHFPLYNSQGETNGVHPYDVEWGSLLGEPDRLQYEPAKSQK